MQHLRCPRCGQDDLPFQIAVKVNILVQKRRHDDYDVVSSESTPDIHSLDLSNDSDCTCTECTYISTLEDFID